MFKGPYRCLYVDDSCSHEECGEWPLGQNHFNPYPEPTEEDYCAAYNHMYYGDDEDLGRCYCGEMIYPIGGPSAESI